MQILGHLRKRSPPPAKLCKSSIGRKFPPSINSLYPLYYLYYFMFLLSLLDHQVPFSDYVRWYPHCARFLCQRFLWVSKILKLWNSMFLLRPWKHQIGYFLKYHNASIIVLLLKSSKLQLCFVSNFWVLPQTRRNLLPQTAFFHYEKSKSFKMFFQSWGFFSLILVHHK